MNSPLAPGRMYQLLEDDDDTGQGNPGSSGSMDYTNMVFPATLEPMTLSSSQQTENYGIKEREVSPKQPSKSNELLHDVVFCSKLSHTFASCVLASRWLLLASTITYQDATLL